jgi:hypothetical protein
VSCKAPGFACLSAIEAVAFKARKGRIKVVMRQVYTSQDSTQVGYYKSILDDAGILSFIRNENSNNPEVSGAAFFPSLCITDDKDYDEAISILKSRQFPASPTGPDWKCPSCSEENPANFGSCWNCDSLKPTT